MLNPFSSAAFFGQFWLITEGRGTFMAHGFTKLTKRLGLKNNSK